MGDSSVEAAKKQGGITRVSSVDFEYFTVLGFYGKSAHTLRAAEPSGDLESPGWLC